MTELRILRKINSVGYYHDVLQYAQEDVLGVEAWKDIPIVEEIQPNKSEESNG